MEIEDAVLSGHGRLQVGGDETSRAEFPDSGGSREGDSSEKVGLPVAREGEISRIEDDPIRRHHPAGAGIDETGRRDGTHREDPILPLGPEFQVRYRQSPLAELPAGELRREGEVLPEAPALLSGELQAAYVQGEILRLEFSPGIPVRVEEGSAGEENIRHVQGESGSFGLPGGLLPRLLLRGFEVEFPIAVLLDGDRGALHPELYDPEFLAQEGEKLDPEGGLLRGDDVRPPVPDEPILHRDVETREEADPQPAAEPDLHPQGVGGGRLQPGLQIVRIHEKNEGGRRQDEKRKESPDREEGDSPCAGHHRLYRRALNR